MVKPIYQCCCKVGLLVVLFSCIMELLLCGSKQKEQKYLPTVYLISCQFGCLRIENHNCLGSYFSTNTSSTIAMPNENNNMWCYIKIPKTPINGIMG